MCVFSCITEAVFARGDSNNVAFGGETVFANNTAVDYGDTIGSGTAKGIYIYSLVRNDV